MHWSMILAAKQDVRVDKNMDFEVRQIRFESWFCYYLRDNLLLGADFLFCAMGIITLSISRVVGRIKVMIDVFLLMR